MTTNALFMILLLTTGAVLGRFSKGLPMAAWAAMALSIVPFGGIALSFTFC